MTTDVNGKNLKQDEEYNSPEIASLGDATQLTEGHGSPNVEGSAGSGVYYNANPPEDDEGYEGES